MSEQVFNYKLGPYLQHFPIDLNFRVKFIRQNFIYNKDYFYFGASFGQMRHGTYGLCFKLENNGNLLAYEGSWLKDQYNGKGSQFLISAPKLKTQQFFRWTEGKWKNGKLYGKGCIKEFNSSTKQWQVKYVGEFLDGHKHGKGIEVFNGNRYQGSFKMGCRHGLGRLIDENGNFYDGNFEQGFPKGEGLQLKGGIICVRGKNEHMETYDKPSNSDLPNLIAKTIKNI